MLDDQARTIIQEADAFFVASYVDREDRRQVDVSIAVETPDSSASATTAS